MADSHSNSTETPSRGRLTFVTQWFPPEPASIALGMARELENQGWEVSVLTGMPNYPTGKLHAGYRSPRPQTEAVSGMRVHRTPLYPYHGASSVKRILNYASWALSSTLFGSRAFAGADVSLVYSSPATSAIAAVVRRRVAGVPYVLVIQDLWPDSIFASGFLTRGLLSRLAHHLTDRFVNWTYAHASHVVVISPGMARVLEDRGVDTERISLVYNWRDESVFRPQTPSTKLKDRLGLATDDFVILYGGNHGAAQGLSALIEAVGLLPSDRNSHAVLIGDGIEKNSLQDLARRVAPDRVHFLDPLPAAEMPVLMASADIQFISLADRPLFRHTMPSKVQAALATGVPSLVAVRGDAADVVTAAGAGIAATPEDASSIANAIMCAQDMGSDALREMGAAARRLYEREMSADSGASKLSRILETVVNENRAQSGSAQRERATR